MKRAIYEFVTTDSRIAGISVAALALCGILATGCQPQIDLVPVHGRVLYQGEPLSYGSVMFQPEGAGPLARGTIEANGQFVLGTQTKADGVRPGRCRVRVTAFESQKTGLGENPHRERSLGRSAIPKKYQNFGTSGLVVDVSAEMLLPLEVVLE